ncbi:MAG: hypothetical protein WC708_12220 [Lentisphaeria bacterium]
MTNEERDQFIAACLNEGKSLSDVQKLLAEQGVSMTYFDLRLLTADLKVNWAKQDPKPAAPPKPAEPAAAAAAALPEDELAGQPPAAGAGRTVVTVSRVVRPGAAMSGDVTFASGAKAEWFLDQYGRLGLNPAKGSAKPTEDDLVAFQEELQNKLGGG